MLIALVVATAVWRSQPIQQATFDGPVYESIEELAREADLVLIGTVSRFTGREIDYGTSDRSEHTEEQGTPVAFFEIAVSDTLRGEVGDSIIVGTPDHDRVVTAGESTPLQVGEEVLLFLRLEHPPGIHLYDSVYTRLGQDNGVFDVTGNMARPRLPEVFSTGETALDLDTVRQAVSASSN